MWDSLRVSCSSHNLSESVSKPLPCMFPLAAWHVHTSDTARDDVLASRDPMEIVWVQRSKLISLAGH